MLRARPEGVLAQPDPVPGHARRHRPQLPGGARLPRPAGARSSACSSSSRASRTASTRAWCASLRTAPATGSRRRCCSMRSRRTATRRSSAGRGATRTRRGPRSASTPSVTTSASGTPRTSGPSCGACTTARIHPGESIRVFPLSNWTELDIWHYIEREQIELPSIYFAHDRDCVLRNGMLYAVNEFIRPKDGESVMTHRVRYRTVGDASLTAAVESDADTVDQGHRGGRPRPGSPSAAPPAATTSSAKPPWKTASARGTSKPWTFSGSPPPGRSTTARARSSGACSTTPRRSSRTRSRPSSGSAGTAARTTPTSPCSPTACAPSASRASRSTSPTATSPRRRASSSSPTPQGTSSTPATW